jgi:transcription initiation factor TFIIB
MEAPDGGERNIGKDDDEPFTREHTGPPSSALYPIERESVIGPSGGYYARLRALDSRGEHDDRVHVAAAVAISTISEALSLPRAVQEEAMAAFLRAHEAGATRGRSVRGIAAAAILYTCRRLGIPRRIADIARAAGLDKHAFWIHYVALVKVLGDSATPPRPEDFVARLASAIAPEGVAGRVARRALELLTAVRALDGASMNGRDPMGIAAAAIYLAAGVEGVKARQVDLAEASGLTEVTVRNSASVLRAALAGGEAAADPGSAPPVEANPRSRPLLTGNGVV